MSCMPKLHDIVSHEHCMVLAFIHCGSMNLILRNLLLVSSCSLEPQKLRIGIMLQFLFRNLQNHYFPQKLFIEVIVYYALQKEIAEDVTEDYQHFLIPKENVTCVYLLGRSML